MVNKKSNDYKFPEKEMNEFLKEKFSGYLEILKNMVDINSFTENREGVNDCGLYTESVFNDLGFKSKRIQSIENDYGEHLILIKNGTGDNNIACVSHLDTVFPPEEEKSNDFKWRIINDRVYGPGTNDVKGGTLLILMVLQLLSSFFPKEFDECTWQLCFDASEETESADFGKVCIDHFNEKTLGCLIFEGGEFNENSFKIVTSRKGRVVFRVTAHGRGAHAGVDHKSGANAIGHLAGLIKEVSLLTDYNKDFTVNIGTVSGGGQINRVPHNAYFEGEMRAFDPEDLQRGIETLNNLKNYSSATHDKGYECKTTIDFFHQCPAWPENKDSLKLFKIWEKNARKLSYEINSEKRGGLSDGNYLWNSVPTIDGLGPGGENAHCSECSADGSKDQEYALLSSFIPKAIINTCAIVDLIRSNAK